eukprot:TRINITY_DN1975_c0_g1_i5.p1 TRINITY_DN1975_c0_g1~~TRINITY_DN1975_c0_g1_i5.p1  ORF type:complete len:153 (+),score=11.30 TRINITY_DN1975_c0_g1_i5:64-459(+)
MNIHNLRNSLFILSLLIAFVVGWLPPDFDGELENVEDKEPPIPEWPERWESPHAFIREKEGHHRDFTHHHHHVKDRDLLSFGKIFYDRPLLKARMTFSNCPIVRKHEFSLNLNCDTTIVNNTVYILSLIHI